ncbi:beta-1,4-N-acetylgalactosaminyltransferase bre-4-like [Uloborus diversus]|uniref:beta-1,4-N-acetylgalactosaminyltransferase bre-4-like n=1 Tax=Uloborus diversus TaxID=327109 RepID=UPI00240A34B7|nr:beta-1,4-N-acetylgalactosaminyltransferase bre-4-like [Uloborus diversus]
MPAVRAVCYAMKWVEQYLSPVGRLKVLTDAPSFEELEKMFSNLDPGGRYKPPTCTSRSKIALIIPYRDRETHLRMFLHNMHPMLQRQMLDYGIYVIEESGDSKFNRAMLMNIGYVEALKQYDYDCFIFHDVDLIPEDDRNLYSCPEQPRHMSVAINTMNYRLPYKDIFGGVSALTKKHMETVNGFSNEFWGWGGEDDDMANRIKFHGLQILRYKANIARYTMLKHKKDDPNPDRYNKLYKGKSRFKKDGLSNLKYKRLDIVLKKLYTWVLVEIEPIKK